MYKCQKLLRHMFAMSFGFLTIMTLLSWTMTQVRGQDGFDGICGYDVGDVAAADDHDVQHCSQESEKTFNFEYALGLHGV